MASPSISSQKPPDQRSKSCETACSSNSSCFFQKRKPVNPLAHSLRSSLSRSTPNSVKQRVLSAKLLKLKGVQNQLNDANFHLAEVIRENQALKILQKRQDKALSKYEGANAELPRLIRSHEEEIRFLTEKNKLLRRSVKELSEQLKHKSEELSSLQEQLKHFERLDKDKHLLEREKLIDELEDVRNKLVKTDGEIVILNRKLALETKTSKQRLNMEMAKHKQCQKELEQALNQISKLTQLLELKEKSNGRKRFSNLAQRQSTSLISLSDTKTLNVTDSGTIPVTDVRLQPINQTTKKEDNQKQYKGILKCPTESIKARLSADSKKDADEDKTSLSGSDKESKPSRPGSSQKLEKIELNLHNTIQKIEDHKNLDEFNKHLGNYCLKAIDSVKTYTDVIETHKENFENAKDDTEKIMERFKDTEKLELKLKRAHVLNFDGDDLTDDNLDFVSQILKEEAEFQAKYNESSVSKKVPTVAATDKKKLLATLRAIDNGDSVDSFESDAQSKSQFIKDLFGDVAD